MCGSDPEREISEQNWAISVSAVMAIATESCGQIRWP